MGQLVATVAGAVGGFLIGGPLGAQIGATLGGMIGATLFGPTIKGPRLSDLKVSASTLGVAIPEVYGTVRIGGNMIWSSGIKETTKKSGGLGKGAPKQQTYTYDATFALALCKGPIQDILRIWADGKLIFDASDAMSPYHIGTGTTFADILRDSGGSVIGAVAVAMINSSKKKNNTFNLRVYRGDEDQLPDSLIVANKGSGNVSAYRGLAYLVFEKLQLDDFGNRIPQITVEVSKNLALSFPSATALDSSGGTLSSSGTAKSWLPDWDLGRLISTGSGVTDVIDLTTMVATAHYPYQLQAGARQRYIQGEGIFITEAGGSNSRYLEVFDATGGTLLSTIAEEGGSLNGGVTFDLAGDIHVQMGALGQLGYCHFSTSKGRALHLLAIGWTRATWAFRYGDPVPIFTDFADFEPTFMFPGREDLASSEIIAWRPHSNAIQMQIWTIGGGAKGMRIPTLTGWEWAPSTDYQKQTLSIKPFDTENYSPSLVLYDPTDDTIFSVGTTNGVPCSFKYGISTGAIKFAVKYPHTSGVPDVPLPPNGMNYSRLDGGTFSWASGAYSGRLVQINLQDGSVKLNTSYDGLSAWGDSVYAGRSQQWDDVSQSLLLETQFGYRRVFFRNGSGGIAVADVVSDICYKTGVLTSGDIDVTGLTTGYLKGYTIDRETTARDALKQLGTGFLFDCYESDYLLKFKTRGSSSVVTIPQDWVARAKDGSVVTETLTQELEMPVRVTVNFYDTTRDNQQGSQSAKRIASPFPTMWTNKEDLIDLPITWTPTDAVQCADKLLKMTWANRTAYSMTLPWRYMKYDPTDVATVTLDDGTVYTMRLGTVNIGADFTLAIQAVSEKSAAYISTAIGSVSDFTGQTISQTYPCFPQIINTPLLRDVDYDANNHSTCYFSIGSNAVKFDGAFLFMMEGTEYNAIGHVSSDSIFGYTQSVLPATTAYESTDETTELMVRLSDIGATLESVTTDDMLTGFANGALVGDEVIQFRTATHVSGGLWKLTGLLRARRGTNYAVPYHTVGERFVLLDANALITNSRPPEEFVTSRLFKGVPDGTLASDATTYPADLQPNDLKPLTPEDIMVTDDGTTVSVAMSRRSRVISPLADGTGYIHYVEGDKLSAKIRYAVWPGLTLADTTTQTAAPVAGTIPLFDSSGVDVPAIVTFPLTDMGSETKFLAKLNEVGVVEGFPKWIEAERVGPDLWNLTELY